MAEKPLREDMIFRKEALIQANADLLQGLRAWHPKRETPGDSPRSVASEFDVRYRRRDPEHSSGCSSSAGWDI